MATGMARGAAQRGKRIAFGDGNQIIWDHYSELIFRDNPNIAAPKYRASDNFEWVPFYRGHRIYNRQVRDRWEWNLDFRATPGEIFLARYEINYASAYQKGFVLVEPNVPAFKSCAPNKQWPVKRYQEVVNRLVKAGYRVGQFSYGRGSSQRLDGVQLMLTENFRIGMSVMARTALYIGPEGGLHHAAATMGKPAVVLFGGFIPPSVTGYEMHTNLTGGVADACGSLKACDHCRAAMEAISVDEVYAAALKYLEPR